MLNVFTWQHKSETHPPWWNILMKIYKNVQFSTFIYGNMTYRRIRTSSDTNQTFVLLADTTTHVTYLHSLVLPENTQESPVERQRKKKSWEKRPRRKVERKGQEEKLREKAKKKSWEKRPRRKVERKGQEEKLREKAKKKSWEKRPSTEMEEINHSICTAK